MILTSADGSQYERIGDQIYVVKTRRVMLYATVTFFILAVIVGAYDYIKDIMRSFSGYKDIMSGNDAAKGVLKISGYTRGNFIRTAVMFVLIFLFIVSAKFINVKTPISKEQVPNDVLLQMNETN